MKIWEKYISGPLENLPVTRVVLTHFHADHSGLASWFIERFGAEVWTTQGTWEILHEQVALRLDDKIRTAQRFLKMCGFNRAMRDEFCKSFDVPLAHAVPPPSQTRFRPLTENETVGMGTANWRIIFGHGHARGHAVFISDRSRIVLTGDQLLARVTPNISVTLSEPDSDPLGGFLETCAVLSDVIHDDALVVPGHGPPFRGARARCNVVTGTIDRALERVAVALRAPKTVETSFEALYRREIVPEKDFAAVQQTQAYLNHLLAKGRAVRFVRPDGVGIWCAA